MSAVIILTKNSQPISRVFSKKCVIKLNSEKLLKQHHPQKAILVLNPYKVVVEKRKAETSVEGEKKSCPNCGSPIEFLASLEKYYCFKCKKYVFC